MSVSRRKFLESCALGAAAVSAAGMPLSLRAALRGVNSYAAPEMSPGGGEGGTPDPVFRPLTDVALETARSLGASYADIRIARYRDQTAFLRTQAEPGGTKIQHMPSVSDSESFGFGVRVLVNGT